MAGYATPLSPSLYTLIESIHTLTVMVEMHALPTFDETKNSSQLQREKQRIQKQSTSRLPKDQRSTLRSTSLHFNRGCSLRSSTTSIPYYATQSDPSANPTQRTPSSTFVPIIPFIHTLPHMLALSRLLSLFLHPLSFSFYLVLFSFTPLTKHTARTTTRRKC